MATKAIYSLPYASPHFCFKDSNTRKKDWKLDFHLELENENFLSLAFNETRRNNRSLAVTKAAVLHRTVEV